ncbi:hypothetical protein HGRIS_004573 [Hohenbuehelia grisea]|uniref:VPS9 domain-containing protein n=1 Tax=Hohenbuehelia grisea TaxID=104357 RepID=A0ABR3JCA8_9AGAR
MTSKRGDAQFPATSIGRVQGSRISRTPSHESLAAHPLLAPISTSVEVQNPLSPSGSATEGAPRYVPYTPRQRVSPSSTTTGSTLQPAVAASPPHQQQGDATNKLQHMNMKAAAQNLGLDMGSVGWTILEKIISESDSGPEWTHIWNALTVGKATLLLPLEPASTNEKLTPEYIRDHVIFCDGRPRDKSHIVTLSGLRGSLESETLVFRSSIHPYTKLFQDILATDTRTHALNALPPLPYLLAPSQANPYPSFVTSAFTDALPLPPRASTTKPPLPPRPAPRGAAQQSSSRLVNPFASLFGHKAPSPLNIPSPTPAAPKPPEPDHVVEISALAINRRVVLKDVGKEMNRALRSEVKESLAGLPGWVIDKVHEFTADFYPVVKSSSKNAKMTTSPKKGALVPGAVGVMSMSPNMSPPTSTTPYAVNAAQDVPEDAAQRFQEFYESLEEELEGGHSPFMSRKKEETAPTEEVETRKVHSEAKIREILETVERTICFLFYDRIYMQPLSDDASHDEALSGRVAALNMLDLGLEHLDVQVGNLGADLDLVVKACGETLTQLDIACRTPSDKAAVLVAAHKIVVDGLGRLPLVRLKSEGSEERRPISAVEEKPLMGLPVTASPEPLSVTPTLSANISPTIVLTEPPETPAQATKREMLEPHAGETPRPSDAPPPLPPRSFSPVQPPKEPTPVSGDVLLPLIIFSVVKANPPHLVSHLLFTQRFRNHAVGGEESYCLINLLAVAEFLENVDLAALGLGDSDKVMSTATLTPLPVLRTPTTPDGPLGRLDEFSESLRGRVGQGVDALAGSANKVITGVVDSSFTILRSLIPEGAAGGTVGGPSPGVSTRTMSEPALNSAERAGFGLLRRQSSGFSIANIAASLPIPGARARSGSHVEESGQQLVTVSRPGSIKSVREEADGESDEDEDGSSEDGEEEEDEDDDGEGSVAASTREHDARSIRSFESMMSEKVKGREKRSSSMRKSLSDRLAHVSGMAASIKDSSPSRRSSILPAVHGPAANRFNSPANSGPPSPIHGLRLTPPNQRFMECIEDDLRVSEVGDLLKEYRRLVTAVRAAGGFDE